MITDKIYSALIDLHQLYNDEFKLILAYVESYKLAFPGPVLNEIRAINDHVFRSIDPQSSEEIALIEIKKAKGHLTRAILDCFKLLLIAYEKDVRGFEDSYKDVNLALVKDGDFLHEMRNLKNIARKKAVEAKTKESKSFPEKEDSYLAYKDAINAYEDIFAYIESSSKALVNAKAVAKKVTKKQKFASVGYAFIGAVFGVILTIICECIKKYFN